MFGLKDLSEINGYIIERRISTLNGECFLVSKDGKEYYLNVFVHIHQPRESYNPVIYKEMSKKFNDFFDHFSRLIKAFKQCSGAILAPTDTFVYKGHIFYAVPYLDSNSLLSEEEIKRCTISDRFHIVKGLICALNRIHKNNIAHGDLCLQNVLIGRSTAGKLVVKLCDWSNAYFSGEVLSPDLFCPYAEYSSPEVVAYKLGHEEYAERITCAADVFAAGILLHELWCGHKPNYEGKNEGMMLADIVGSGKEYQIDESIPEDLQKIIRQMLDPVPEERPSMDEILKELDNKNFFTVYLDPMLSYDTAKSEQSDGIDRSKVCKYKIQNRKEELTMEDFEKELGALGDLELGDVEDVNLDEIDSLEAAAPTETASSDTKPTIVQDALGGITTYVDIVFCIDVTASMAPIINTVKNLTLDLYDDLITNMREKNNRIVKQLRVKVIAFRDYYCDGPYAMEESSFFTLPDQKAEFRNFVASLEAKGGGDEPENALEAMALAMKSDWVKVTNPNTEKARNVVVIFTDASAHPLEKSADGVSEYYPADMLKSYNELYEAWCGQGSCMDNSESYTMDKMAERLVIFAPEDAYPWSDMAEEIDYAAVVPISAAEGGAELGRDTIIATISGSMR